jgi:uncharacterized protein YbjT (DUF2867 family)
MNTGSPGLVPGTGTVLVAGATGRTGRLVVAELAARGHQVRALVRDRARASDLPSSVERVVGEPGNPASLSAALAGTAAVISALGGRSPFGANGFRRVDYEMNCALIDAAAAAGVRRFVMITAGSAGRSGLPYSLPFAPYPWKARAETHLRSSGIGYTIIGPGGLTDDPGGRVGIRIATRRDYRTGRITRADVAAIAAECIAEGSSAGRTLTCVNDASLAPEAWRSALATLPADEGLAGTT